jgi:hypothetical protein
LAIIAKYVLVVKALSEEILDPLFSKLASVWPGLSSSSYGAAAMLSQKMKKSEEVTEKVIV